MEHALFIGNNCDVAFLFFSNLSRVCFPVICPYCIANIWQLSHLFQVGSWIDFRRLNSSFLSDLTDQRSIRVRVFRLRRSNETALAFFFVFLSTWMNSFDQLLVAAEPFVGYSSWLLSGSFLYHLHRDCILFSFLLDARISNKESLRMSDGKLTNVK